MKLCKLLLFTFFCSIQVFTQIPFLTIQNNNVFDNQEYFNSYKEDGTYFFSQAFLSAGFNFNRYHSFSAGALIQNEYGLADMIPAKLLLNYQYNDSMYSMLFGRFNYNYIKTIEPVFLSREYKYIKPYVDGIAVSRTINSGYTELMIDWTGKQFDTIREAFHVYFFHEQKFNHFYSNFSFILSHLAHPEIRIDTLHIRDNLAMKIMAGYEYVSDNQLFVMNFSAGFLQSFDRERSVYDWRNGSSFVSNLKSSLGNIHLDVMAHVGNEHYITNGDPFFSAPYYIRNDIFYLKKFEKVYIQGGIAVHLIDGVIDLSQELKVCIKLDKITVSSFNENQAE